MDFPSSDAGQLITLRLSLAVFSAGLGAAVASSLKKISHLGLCLLISFAAGALLAVTLVDILPESLEASGFLPGVLSFASGYLLFWFLTRYVSHVCPACAATHHELNFRAITITMVIALSVHSFMDGLAIASAASESASLGMAILLAVGYHKFPEGLALSAVALSSGMSRSRAFLVSISIEAVTTVAGGLTGLWLHLPGESRAAGLILGHVGGGFLFIVLHALLGEAVRHHPKSTVPAALVGAASILAVQYFFL